MVWAKITLPTRGLKSHLTHLRYVPFVFCNPPLLKSGVNKYFCPKFMSLSSQNKKKTLKQEKIRSKGRVLLKFISLFLSSSQSNSLLILRTLHQNGSTGVGRGCLANRGVEIGVRGVVEMWQIGVSWWRWLLGLVQWWVVVLVARLGSCVCFKFRWLLRFFFQNFVRVLVARIVLAGERIWIKIKIILHKI